MTREGFYCSASGDNKQVRRLIRPSYQYRYATVANLQRKSNIRAIFSGYLQVRNQRSGKQWSPSSTRHTAHYWQDFQAYWLTAEATRSSGGQAQSKQARRSSQKVRRFDARSLPVVQLRLMTSLTAATFRCIKRQTWSPCARCARSFPLHSDCRRAALQPLSAIPTTVSVAEETSPSVYYKDFCYSQIFDGASRPTYS